MLPNPRDLGPIELPPLIASIRIKDTYELRLIPGGFRMKNGDRGAGFRAELTWQNPISQSWEQVRVEYQANCSVGDVWISRSHTDEVVYFPQPRDQITLREYARAWRDADVDAVVRSLKLEIGQYELLRVVEKWRWAFLADHLPRQSELIEDMALFVDQTMDALVTQFPEHDHIFPTPNPAASLGIQ